MNQQPDKLFRDKLENYEKVLAPSAWDRIAAAQPQKNQNRVWLKVAASLLLAAVAGAAWMWTRSDASGSSTLAVVQPTKSQPLTPASAEVAHPAERPTNTVEVPQLSPPAESKTLHKTGTSGQRAAQRNGSYPDPAKRADVPENGQADSRDAAGTHNNDVAIRTESESHPRPEELVPSMGSQGAEKTILAHGDPVAQTTDTESISQGVTLSYSTKEVSAYLDKNFNGDATDDDKKQSTLKKLLQKANDLKTNQDTFGELRQRKNEILALNFKNDKRGQKTRN